jgi:hypothetical protein
VSGMIEPNIFDFYSFSGSVSPLRTLHSGAKVRDDADTIEILRHATHVADWFALNDFCKTHLPSSGAKLAEIKNFVMDTFLKPPEGATIPDTITAFDENLLRDQVHEFETLLEDELKRLPVYILDDEKIGNFSIRKLLRGASNGYPQRTRDRLTQESRNEIDEAGKCLVYERSTAAGFHILRSIELTIRQYLVSLPGFVMPPLNRQNWGEYLRLLKDNGAPREVTDHLHNIKDNYRNPLMHPEDTMDADEAVSIFGIAQSMNEMLVTDMLKRSLIP